jgi:hypothetical protein
MKVPQLLGAHLLPAVLLGVLGVGCQTVEFWELEALADPVMTMEATACEVHFHQKVFYSMEGSAGGIGEGAGGGCGCY